MNILVTDGNYKHSLAIIRALGIKGHRIYVLSNIPNCVGAFSRFCFKNVVLRYRHLSEVNPNDVLQIVLTFKIDVIIPVGAESFQYFGHNRRIFEEYVCMALPPQESLTIALSKEKTYKTLSPLPIRVPKTIYPCDLQDVRNISCAAMGGKLVIKGRYETGHSIVDYVDKDSDLLPKYQALCKKYDLQEHELPLIQEYISGEGRGFFAIYSHGVCGPTFQHRRLFEYPPTGGASIAAESISDDLVDATGRSILDYLNWHGVAMVEFKCTANNDLVLMEINPKFWGSLDLAIESGVNFPTHYVETAGGKEMSYARSYQIGLKYHWPFPAYLQLILKFPRSVFKVFRMWLTGHFRSNIWLRKDFAGTCGLFVSPLLRQTRNIVAL